MFCLQISLIKFNEEHWSLNTILCRWVETTKLIFISSIHLVQTIYNFKHNVILSNRKHQILTINDASLFCEVRTFSFRLLNILFKVFPLESYLGMHFEWLVLSWTLKNLMCWCVYYVYYKVVFQNTTWNHFITLWISWESH